MYVNLLGLYPYACKLTGLISISLHTYGVFKFTVTYIDWHRNYAWSKLELLNLHDKKQIVNFDHAQLLCQLRYKLIQYLILKLQLIKVIYLMISAPQILAHYKKIYNFQPIFMKHGERIISWVTFTQFQEDWPKIVDFLIKSQNWR